jgi:predicted acyltransferase
MVFVSDLWTLKGVLNWLEHISAYEDGAYEDGMGLSDPVFPVFLFIVG